MTGEGEPEGEAITDASKMTEGEIVSEAAGDEVAEAEQKPKKLKKKHMKAILEMEMKFKKVGFEQALTAEEKVEKKAARLAKKQKKKGKKEESTGEVAAEKIQEDSKEKTIEKDEETKEEGTRGGEADEKEDKAEAKKTEQEVEADEKEDKEEAKKTEQEVEADEKEDDAEAKKIEQEVEADEKEGKVEAKKTEQEVEADEKEDKEEAKKTEQEVEAGKKEAKKSKKEKAKQYEEISGEKKRGKKREKKGKKKKAKAKVADAQEQPIEEGAGEKPEEEKKPKGKKGKKKSDAESATEEEGDEGKKEKKDKETPETSEALTTEEEGDVSEKVKKQKKKRKKGVSVVPSDTAVSQPPAEGGELGEAEPVGIKKKAGKKGKQVRMKVEDKKSSRVSIKEQTISPSASTGVSGSLGMSLGDEVSSSSSEEVIDKKVERKRKKTGKKQKKSEDLTEEQKAKEEEQKKAKEEEHKKAKEEEHKKDEEPKGKKKKKKKKKKGDEIEPKIEESDIMAQIRRMKAQAEAQAAGGEVIEEKPAPPPKKKKKKKKGRKGPKKKLTKKQRAVLTQEQAEKARIQAELEAQRLIEEEKKRIQEEKKMAKEKETREIAEQAFRNEQLTFSTGLINAMLDQNWKISDEEKSDSEWAQYLKCDGLPNPTNPPQMNTYLHLWEQVINDVTVEEVVRRTNEVLELLETLQTYIDDPFDVSESLVDDWKWIRGLCRDHQKETQNMATYRLLRDIDSRLNRIDIPTANFNISDKHFNLCLYVLVQLPTPMYNTRNISKTKLEIDFSDIKMNVVYPLSVDSKFVATRAMYLKFDHLSDTCVTYDPFTIPAQYELNLLEATSEEWYKQLLYKYENRKRPEKKTVEDEFGNLVEIEPPPEPELVEGELPPTVPFQLLEPPAPQYVVDLEDEVYTNNRADDRLEIVVEENVVNLRKYMMIGGVYYLELFYQPPQPKDLVAFEVRLTALKLPKRLEEVPVYIEYVPPPPEDPLVQKTPEELEQDVKKQEEILDSLISITMTLPEHVMFLDLPIVCQWDSERKVWTTQDVIDLKHIEEQNYITFRTGLFGPFALGVNRYLNFPFQMWEIKPEIDGTVTFQLTCAILMIEFNIKNNTICMTQLQNSPNNALQDVIGVYFKLSKLIRILRDGGVDIFPAYDAFKYVEGVSEKQWPMEKHTYYSMGLLSCTFNFTYSRWNNQAGRRKLVMQMREYHPEKPKQKTHNMFLVSPLNAIYIDCTEVSPAFNETPIEDLKFCSDMFHLMKATCSITTRNKVLNGPQDVAKALADILIATRILSFSS